MSKKKVALLKSRLGVNGGVEKYTYHLAEAFARRGCEVSVLTTGLKKPPLNSPCEWVNVGEPQKLSVRSLTQFDQQCQNWLKNHPCHIVFGMDRNRSQTHYRAGNGVHAAWLQHRSSSETLLKRLSFRINPLHQKTLQFEKEAYENPSLQRLFTNSHLVRHEILEHYNTDPSKIQVVHNGVEWKLWQDPFEKSLPLREDLCRQLQLDPTSFIWVFVGSGYKRKGLEKALEALHALPHSSWQLAVVGKESHLPKYQERIHQLGLEKRVKIFGSQPNALPFYQVGNGLILPSLYDPFANVTVEALTMGLRVITSTTNGGAEVLTKDSGRALHPLAPVEQWSEAMAWAMEQPQDFYHQEFIRQSVSHLDFPNQLDQIIAHTLSLEPTHAC